MRNLRQDCCIHLFKMLQEMEKQTGEKYEFPRTGFHNHNWALGASWLNSCLQETLLPGKPWHKVLDRLEAALAAEVKNQLKNSAQRGIVFHLLGQSFVKRYFSSCPGGSNLLSCGAPREISKLEEAAKAWLQDRCVKAAEHIHCQLSLDAKVPKLDPEMVHFLNDIYNVVVAKMEQLLATCEIRRKEKSDQDCETCFQVSQQSLSRNHLPSSMIFTRPKSIESIDIRLALWKRPPSHLNREDAHLYIRPVIDPDDLSCPESDLLGDLLCAIISQGSENLSTVCERLSGKLLPKRLRQFVWLSKLLGAASKSHKDKTLATSHYKEVDSISNDFSLTEVLERCCQSEEKIAGKVSDSFCAVPAVPGCFLCSTGGQRSTEREARVIFGHTVARRTAELKLRTATRSPVSGLIENAVVEKYRKIPCMSPFSVNEQMILESSKTLNVLYVFNGNYEPYFIYWLFPLQIAFQQIMPADEHPYELAMYLHSLHQNLFPSWAKIQAVADSVMNLLEREDVTFFNHLQSSFRKNITIDHKDFLVNQILQEQVSAQQILAFEKRDHPMPSLAKELLASPVFFLRKWMGEGFVGVLSLPAMMLVWDQFFMQDWNINMMQMFCASVLLLLKDSFMAAEDYPAIREVFLLYPSSLLTADIQKAWIHLQEGGLPADIPGFNSLSQRDRVDGFLEDGNGI